MPKIKTGKFKQGKKSVRGMVKDVKEAFKSGRAREKARKEEKRILKK